MIFFFGFILVDYKKKDYKNKYSVTGDWGQSRQGIQGLVTLGIVPFKREISFVTSFLLSCTPSPIWKKNLKGKKLLPFKVDSLKKKKKKKSRQNNYPTGPSCSKHRWLNELVNDKRQTH